MSSTKILHYLNTLLDAIDSIQDDIFCTMTDETRSININQSSVRKILLRIKEVEKHQREILNNESMSSLDVNALGEITDQVNDILQTVESYMHEEEKQLKDPKLACFLNCDALDNKWKEAAEQLSILVKEVLLELDDFGTLVGS